jgi:hypothetical protein
MARGLESHLQKEMLEDFTITRKYEHGNANFKYNISDIPRHRMFFFLFDR